MQVCKGEYIIRDSIVDGVGLRNVLFTQGCAHNCRGCHNPSTHSFDGVYKSNDILVKELLEDSITNNVTISGGDPMYQAEELIDLLQKLKEHKCNIWVYTGFKIEELKGYAREALKYIDVLVDGEFKIEEKSIELEYRGSKNQRIIYLNKGKIKRIINDSEHI